MEMHLDPIIEFQLLHNEISETEKMFEIKNSAFLLFFSKKMILPKYFFPVIFNSSSYKLKLLFFVKSHVTTFLKLTVSFRVLWDPKKLLSILEILDNESLQQHYRKFSPPDNESRWWENKKNTFPPVNAAQLSCPEK